MKRILLAGYFGMGNLGDEAILEGELTYLQREIPNLKISVLSGAPEKTSKAFLCQSFNRSSLRDVFQAVSSCDIFVLGGGGIFQDVTSFRSLLYYLFLLEVAKKKGKKVAVFAMGIGPLKRKISEFLVKRALLHSDSVSLRDRQSYDWAIKRGIEKAFLSADASFLLTPPAPRERKMEIGVSVRSWRGLNTEELKKFLIEMSKKGYTLSLIVFNPEDREISRSLVSQTGGNLLEPQSPREALELLAGMEAAIAMRLHCAILSTIAGTPFLAISYDPKVQAFAEEIGQPFLCLEDINKNNLHNLFGKWEVERLKEGYLTMRKRAEEGINLLARLR
ncbi:polysaccharide pyruvyl transferase CsaB [bacterium]|nr:polysaccharide pyruvyl transferase CsaB [bacterium]